MASLNLWYVRGLWRFILAHSFLILEVMCFLGFKWMKDDRFKHRVNINGKKKKNTVATSYCEKYIKIMHVKDVEYKLLL